MDKYFKYKYDDLFNPTLQAIRILGGSGSIQEIEEKVTQILGLQEEAVNEIHRESTTYPPDQLHISCLIEHL